VRVEHVERVDDPRLSGYALLGAAGALRRSGSFIAEGRLVVQRLLQSGRYVIESLLLNPAALSALEPELVELDAPVYVCAPTFFEGLTGHHFHRGCLALAKRPREPSLAALLERARTLVVLERVGDADNVGSVFRNAAAFGADAVLLGPGCADPLYRKAIRTSMAATLYVPFTTLGTPQGPAFDPTERWPACVGGLRQHGFELLALTPRQPAKTIDEWVTGSGGSRVALLVGTEGDGLSPELSLLATERLRIAMRPGVDSVNLAVATGIALSRLMRP
jgi:tRNA G18 (ribose-2'-O)-methylase SpoU